VSYFYETLATPEPWRAPVDDCHIARG
jgi:hypothetical protein